MENDCTNVELPVLAMSWKNNFTFAKIKTALLVLKRARAFLYNSILFGCVCVPAILICVHQGNIFIVIF